jgi:putative tryptophan/tyrosine transport system substrate-binding protein
MRRREFIAGLGSAAAWPMVAPAQQAPRPLIGYLSFGSAASDAFRLPPFRQGLNEAGYVENQNCKIEYLWAEGRYDRLPNLAAELVRKQVAVLVSAGGPPVAMAAKAATSSIPILFITGADPVNQGLVSNLARPDANITGVFFFTSTLGPKRLELLRELAPKSANIAVLVTPLGLTTDFAEVSDAARTLGLSLRVMNAASDVEIDAAFRTFAQERPDALLVISSPEFTNQRAQIVALANHYRVPAIYALREFVTSGGLMSYGASLPEAYRQVGIYAGRILSGAKPADLPVMQSTKFELMINLKTAKALGLTVPETLLATATEVIE